MTLDRKAIAAAIFDPGATEGLKGDRTLTEWQTDAVMRALSTAPSGQAPLEGVKALDDELLEDFREDTEGDGECRFPKGNVRKLIAEIDRIRSALLPASAEPVGWQHRIYYEDIGKWSDWRDGKRNTRFDNEFEERPVYASPPASGAVEAGWRDPNSGEIYTAEQLANFLKVRDKFIVDHGLWADFVARLHDAAPTEGR